MTDYNKTIIYKLINYDFPELVYIGSTTNFTKRKYQHKHAAFNIDGPKYCRKLYVSIRENGGWDSWEMVQICEFPCNNKREAEQEEDRHMMELKANLNMNRAYCSKERRQEQKKNGQEKRKERLGPDGIKEYNKIKDAARQEKKKQYYIEKRQNYMKEKITCDCGDIICKGALTRHKRTNKHENNMKNI
jgi:hypothetical protein